MTIDSAYVPEVFTKRSTLLYKFGFEISIDSSVNVYAIDADGVYTLLDSALYTLTLNNYRSPISQGGTIEFAAALDASVVSISINRLTPITDTQDFPNGEAFNAQAYEYQADKLTLILQELNASVCDCRGGGAEWPAEWTTTSTSLFLADTNVYLLVASGSNAVTQKYKGRFAINPANNEIMIFPRGSYDVSFSSDGGGTWAVKTPVPIGLNPLSYLISHAEYDPVSDGFYLLQRNAGTPDNQEFRYSLDDGATWQRSTAGDTNQIDSYTLTFIMKDGNIYGHGLSSTQNHFYRILDPSGADTGSLTPIVSGASSSNKWAVGILGNGTYMAGFWSSSAIMTNSLDPADGVVAVLNTGGSNLNVAFGTVEALQFAGETTAGVLTFNRVTKYVSPPYPTTTCDFSSAGTLLSYATGIWFGNGSFVVTTRTVDAPNTLLIRLADENTMEWSPIYSVDIDGGAIFLSSNNGGGPAQQMEYWKDDWWMFSYQANISGGQGRVALVKFQLPAGP